MLNRVVLSVVAGIAAFLICILIGGLLAALEVSFAVTVGQFLVRYASLIGSLAALWFFFSGRTSLKV